MREQRRTILILIIVLAALGFYAVVPLRLTYANIALRKIALPQSGPTPPLPANDTAATAPYGQQGRKRTAAAKKPMSGDVTILFFGDSMLEELSRRLDDYAVANHYHMETVIWYGSTTEKWGLSQTLRHLVKKYKPTYLWVCLGGNELFVRDLEERDTYIKLLLAQVGDLPFVWIGPPNWKKDTGINDLIRRNVGNDHFFDSSNLQLKRKSDGRHPTHEAAAQWGDAVAAWLQSSQNAQPLVMKEPERPARCEIRVFQPDFEGYQ